MQLVGPLVRFYDFESGAEGQARLPARAQPRRGRRDRALGGHPAGEDRRRAGAHGRHLRQRARRARHRPQDRGAAHQGVRRPRDAARARRRDQAAEAPRDPDRERRQGAPVEAARDARLRGAAAGAPRRAVRAGAGPAAPRRASSRRWSSTRSPAASPSCTTSTRPRSSPIRACCRAARRSPGSAAAATPPAPASVPFFGEDGAARRGRGRPLRRPRPAGERRRGGRPLDGIDTPAALARARARRRPRRRPSTSTPTRPSPRCDAPARMGRARRASRASSPSTPRPTRSTPCGPSSSAFSLALEPGRAAYVPLQHRGDSDLFGGGLLPGQIPAAEALEALRPLLRGSAPSSRSART